MLHIGLNAQLLSLTQNYRSAGISWYICGLLKHLAGFHTPYHQQQQRMLDLERAARFSWRKTAEETMKIYEHVLGA